MSNRRHAAPPAPAPAAQPGLPLSPLPEDLETEEHHETANLAVPGRVQPVTVPVHMAQAVTSLLLVESPEKVLAIIAGREKLLAQIQAAAIKSTTAQDWTLYKDKAGKEVAVMRDSGAVKIRKWMGISIGNHRPITDGVAEPRLSEEQVPEIAYDKATNSRKPTGNTVRARIAEMWADGFCTLTGERVSDVYVGVRTIDGFVGRGHDQDLKASCRTSLDTKVVRILSGLRKVDVQMLKDAGLNPEKCYLGSGYGTSEERGARGVTTEEGLADRQKRLREEILRRVSGNEESARGLLKDITYWKKGDKEGWSKSVDQITQGWQMDKAEAALVAHAVFGGPMSDKAAPAPKAENGGGGDKPAPKA